MLSSSPPPRAGAVSWKGLGAQDSRLALLPFSEGPPVHPGHGPAMTAGLTNRPQTVEFAALPTTDFGSALQAVVGSLVVAW